MPARPGYTLALPHRRQPVLVPGALALLTLALVGVSLLAAYWRDAAAPTAPHVASSRPGAAVAAADVEQVPAPTLTAEVSSVTSETQPDQAAPDASNEPATQEQPSLPVTVQVSAPAAVAAAPPAPPPPPPVVAAASPAQTWAAQGFVFVLDGQDWDETSTANVDAALSKLPAFVRSRLGNRAFGPMNILVNREGRTLSGKQPYGGAANFFSTNDSRNELVLYPDQSVLTTLHELGHAYNLRNVAAGRYALVLLDPEMQSFMAATGWRVLSTPDEVRSARDQLQVKFAYDGPRIWTNLSHDDPLEDFANSFALYFYAPEDLRAKSPERFAWFETHLLQP
jgi:hypothetical protein